MTRVNDRIGCVTVLEVLEAAQARERDLRGYRGSAVHPDANGAHVWVRCDCLLEFLVRARALGKRKDDTRCGHRCELGKASRDVPEWTTCRNPLCGGKLRSDNTTGFCSGCVHGNVSGGRRWYRLSHPEEWRVQQRERAKALRSAKALRGECTWCPAPALDGSAFCAACKAKERASRQARKASRKLQAAAWRVGQIAAGLCVCCPNRAVPEKKKCERHLAADSANKLARYHARKQVDEARREAA